MKLISFLSEDVFADVFIVLGSTKLYKKSTFKCCKAMIIISRIPPKFVKNQTS